MLKSAYTWVYTRNFLAEGWTLQVLLYREISWPYSYAPMENDVQGRLQLKNIENKNKSAN